MPGAVILIIVLLGFPIIFGLSMAGLAALLGRTLRQLCGPYELSTLGFNHHDAYGPVGTSYRDCSSCAGLLAKLVVVVKPFFGFSPKPTGIDHFFQKGCGPVLRVLKVVRQNIHDRKQHIKPNEIREG